LAAGCSVTVPADQHVHVFVPVGSGDLEGAGLLSTGDAVRLTDADARVFTAGPEGAELSVWATA
ncbi:MAG: pirin family protein, partial [Actinomycetota bacterium]